MTTLETPRSTDPTPPAIQEAPLPWDAIIARVMERAAKQHRGKTGALRHAERVLRDELAKARRVAANLEVVHVASAALIKPIEDYLLKRLDVHVREFEFHFAQSCRKTASAVLQEQLNALDGFVLDDDALEFLPHVGLVLRRDAGSQVRELRRVVDAAEAAANGDLTPFPPSDVVNTGDFEKDLRSFLAQHDEAGRDFVRRLCGDRGLAEKVSTDQESPAPIRFLARMVLQARPATLREVSVVGFART